MLWMVVLAVLGLCVLLYLMLRQQGRVLLRLDRLEARLTAVERAPWTDPHANHQPASKGLAVGTTIEPFTFTDLSKRPVGLEDFRGKRVLLVQWSPRSAGCGRLAPELGRLQEELDERDVQLLLVASGSGQANRRLAAEHNLRCPILLRSGSLHLQAFDGFQAPAAYLLDADGRVAEPAALGWAAVRALAHHATTAPVPPSAAGSGDRQRRRRPVAEITIVACLVLLAANALADNRARRTASQPSAGLASQTSQHPGPTALQVVKFGFTQRPHELVGDADFTYAAVLKNPNDDWVATAVDVEIAFLSRAGRPVTTDHQHPVLLPGQTAAVADSLLGQRAARMRVRVRVGHWQPASQPQATAVSVRQVRTTRDAYGATTSAILRSRLGRGSLAVSTVAVYSDQRGRIIGGASNVVDVIPADRSVQVQIYASPPPNHIARTAVYATLRK
jgi:peroxiredoxin